MATATKTQGKHKNGKKARHSEVTDSRPVNNGTRPPMTAKEFERELEPLQEELVKLQEWVKATGAKICIVFEGRMRRRGGTIMHHRKVSLRCSVSALSRRRSESRCTSAISASPAAGGRHLRPG
jgi:polyphosphate kinase 2 (PPK2 family)